jgi:hypothetical protein
MREFLIGNILIRQSTDDDGRPVFMGRGDKVLSHRHNFGHPTFCLLGSLAVRLVRPTQDHLSGFPRTAEIIREIIVNADDGEPWVWIPPMEFHEIECLSDVARYACIYAHRAPQAIRLTGTAEDWGGSRPLLRKDEAGETWMRIDESIVQISANWPDAYR